MKKWKFYTSRELKPAGWLRSQLEIQAEGLSGNLDIIWPDVRDSAWIGGDREGWERVPYWLDGFIPLAYLLEREDLIIRAKRYIDAILANQKEDGWICPCEEEERPGYDSWAVLLITKVLKVYYDCSGDERIPDVIYRVLKNYYELLQSGCIRLFDWGKFRWFEGAIALNFLWERYREEWIPELMALLKVQGADYNSFTSLWERPLNRWRFDTHIVNLAMMLKAEAVSCDLLDVPYTDNAEYLRGILDRFNGTAFESFTGDECLSGLSPIQGTELCAIVEQMYSYELLYAYTGDHKWAQRLEVLAFNALSATLSEDMWTHQYVQMSNQIACERFPGKSVFRTNGEEAHLFGLEPNYGCCTANFNQSWPKFALSAFLHRGNTILNGITVPSELKTENQRIRLDTNYPFDNTLHYSITAGKPFTFEVRIPSFAENLRVNGVCRKGEELRFEIEAGTTEIEISFDVSPVFQKRPHDLHAVQMGSLLFSVPVRYEKRMREYEEKGVERKYPYCDYELVPCSEWAYAYCSHVLEPEQRGVGETPFSGEKPPVIIKAKVKRILWGLADGYDTVCAKIPESREGISAPLEIELYPYGCSRLRMTELPIIDV